MTLQEIKRELEAFETVKNKISWEGVNYCFHYYSDFKEVKDVKFHELRKAYLKGVVRSKLLIKYVDERIHELKQLISTEL